ncbi:unnamed protein product [Rhodiola kirilowii]
MSTIADKPHLDLELGESRCSAAGETNGDSRASEIVRVSEKKSGEESVAVDLESGALKVERDCRICHLSLEAPDQTDLDVAIVLGCSCKEDLAAAHKKCAEDWFKIKGNKTCEICGAIAKNVTGPGPSEPDSIEHWSELNDATPPSRPTPHPTEIQNFWQGHRFLNFLLACMVFAFVISWLFHFNIHLRET